MRDDWSLIRADFMKQAVTAKFTQHENLKQLLLATSPHPLVQLKPGDGVWGSGPSGNGENLLGVILQELRHQLLLQ
jgi:ribA/ribD-fused uncharacterized protein